MSPPLLRFAQNMNEKIIEVDRKTPGIGTPANPPKTDRGSASRSVELQQVIFNDPGSHSAQLQIQGSGLKHDSAQKAK
jgi:hypothetical protein